MPAAKKTLLNLKQAVNALNKAPAGVLALETKYNHQFVAEMRAELKMPRPSIEETVSDPVLSTASVATVSGESVSTSTEPTVPDQSLAAGSEPTVSVQAVSTGSEATISGQPVPTSTGTTLSDQPVSTASAGTVSDPAVLIDAPESEDTHAIKGKAARGSKRKAKASPKAKLPNKKEQGCDGN